MTKPVGSRPITIDGIIMRQSVEMPDGMQALYDEKSGQVLWVGKIGTSPGKHIRATAITVSPGQYELIMKSHIDAEMRERKRRFNS